MNLPTTVRYNLHATFELSNVQATDDVLCWILDVTGDLGFTEPFAAGAPSGATVLIDSKFSSEGAHALDVLDQATTNGTVAKPFCVGTPFTRFRRDAGASAVMKSGAWKVPVTRRKMLAFRPVPPGPSSTSVTVNDGVPSANAWSRTARWRSAARCR